MTEALVDWFTELRRPLSVPEFEPDIDDKDKEKDTELRKGFKMPCLLFPQRWPGFPSSSASCPRAED